MGARRGVVCELHDWSADSEFTELLKGRYITDIVDDEILVLDNGMWLHVETEDEGFKGGTFIQYLNVCGRNDARIMSAHLVDDYGEDPISLIERQTYTLFVMSAYVDCDEDDGNPSTVYTIFVMVDGNPHHLPLATVRGDDGNGYYGTGFTLTPPSKHPPRRPLRSRPVTSSRPSRVRKHPRLSPVFLAAKASSMLSLTLSSEREALIRLCVLPAPRLGFFIS